MYETNHTSERLKLLFKILIPVLIYQLANFSAQFIDTVMTGQYHEMHLAGVSIAGSLYNPFFTLLNGIVAALIPIVGQLLGKLQDGFTVLLMTETKFGTILTLENNTNPFELLGNCRSCR